MQDQGAIVSQCFQRRAGEVDVFSCCHEEDAVLALDGDAGGGMQHILVLCMQHGVLHGDVVIRGQRYLLFRMDDTTLLMSVSFPLSMRAMRPADTVLSLCTVSFAMLFCPPFP